MWCIFYVCGCVCAGPLEHDGAWDALCGEGSYGREQGAMSLNVCVVVCVTTDVTRRGERGARWLLCEREAGGSEAGRCVYICARYQKEKALYLKFELLRSKGIVDLSQDRSAPRRRVAVASPPCAR